MPGVFTNDRLHKYSFFNKFNTSNFAFDSKLSVQFFCWLDFYYFKYYIQLWYVITFTFHQTNTSNYSLIGNQYFHFQTDTSVCDQIATPFFKTRSYRQRSNIDILKTWTPTTLISPFVNTTITFNFGR